MKQHVLTKELCIELGIKLDLPFINCETSWSIIFTMVNKEFESKPFIIAVTNRIKELSEIAVTEAEWHTAEMVGKFLYCAAVLTEHQSRQQIITLSLSMVLFNKVQEMCRGHLNDRDVLMAQIASKLHIKLDHYAKRIDYPLLQLARVLGSFLVKMFLMIVTFCAIM